MTRKQILLVGGMVGFLLLSSCRSVPIQPSVNQTVISVLRHSSATGLFKGNMEIYIDGRVAQTIGRRPKTYRLRAGESISIPVNNGVHTIYVKIGSDITGNNTSDAINFTADSTTVAFVATYEGVPPLRRLTLSRSIVEDDTGSMTGRRVQEAF